MPPSLTGIHHVSAITGRAPYNVQFYTETLGLRLVCKTVNQDDPSSYHLFYGDETGSPGTDLTFFDLPRARDLRPGPGLITGTSLRVRGREALAAWAERLDAHGVRRTPIHERAGRAALTLQDDENQTLHLVDDAADRERVPNTTPWQDGPVPATMAVRGLGPVEITVPADAETRAVFTDVLGFREARTYAVSRAEDADAPATALDLPASQSGDTATVLETGPGGVASEVHLIERSGNSRGWLGIGGVHHLALRTGDEDTIRQWRVRVVEAGIQVSPVIDRHYFTSIYLQMPGGFTLEIATDTGAPFPVDEAAAGRLTLPPKLEPRRDAIEAQLASI